MPLVAVTAPYSPLSMMPLSISTDSLRRFCRQMPMCSSGWAASSATNSRPCASLRATGFSQKTWTPCPAHQADTGIVQPVRQADMDAVGSFRPHHLLIVGIKRGRRGYFSSHIARFSGSVSHSAPRVISGLAVMAARWMGAMSPRPITAAFFMGLFRLRRRGAGRALWQGAPRGAVTVCPRYSRTGNLPSAAMRLFSSAA